jgi:hypothetical protein
MQQSVLYHEASFAATGCSPSSDRYGWRNCNWIVGTILALDAFVERLRGSVEEELVVYRLPTPRPDGPSTRVAVNIPSSSPRSIAYRPACVQRPSGVPLRVFWPAFRSTGPFPIPVRRQHSAPPTQNNPCASVHSARRSFFWSKGSGPRATVPASDDLRDSWPDEGQAISRPVRAPRSTLFWAGALSSRSGAMDANAQTAARDLDRNDGLFDERTNQ